jgi:ADP-heptose:LPS heptosyltransferase
MDQMAAIPKITFMTTTGVNVGDEFIREGICSFLDEIFSSWEPFYVNKHNLITLHQRVYDENATLCDKFRDADIIIQAGAPVYWKIDASTSYNVEWAEELWEKRIFQLGPLKPVLNIAAGACQPYPDFAKTFLSDPRCIDFARRVAHACRWTSVRDPLASQILYALDIEHDVLPCSAFHAARRVKGKIDDNDIIGINLMSLGGHFKLSDDVDSHAWGDTIDALVTDLRSRHNLIFIAHDLQEKEFMQRLTSGGEEVFYSTRYEDYMTVYANCKAVLANRVHGAVCAAGFGRPAVIVGNDTRLQIGDYIGLPSRYVGMATADELIDLVEEGIVNKVRERERLIALREESAIRYREAIMNNLPEYFGTSIKSSARYKEIIQKKGYGLASAEAPSSHQYRDFMTTLDHFARRLGLHQSMNESRSWEYPWLWFNGLSKLDLPNITILALGGEFNPVPLFLASMGAKVTIVACDGQFTSMWERVRVETGLTVDWQIASPEKLPFPDKSFDVVTMFSGKLDKKLATQEIARVLKPGGVLALTFDVLQTSNQEMAFPERNRCSLTIDEFNELIWNHQDFDNINSKVNWNIADINQDIDLESTLHHDSSVGAAVMVKRIIVVDQVKRILLPRFDTFGDIVLLEGFLEALQLRFPEAEITMLVREGYDQLATLFPERLSWLTTHLYPYRNLDEDQFPDLESFLDSISSESWDLVLFTTYNRTWIDEVLAAKLKESTKISLGNTGNQPEWLNGLLVKLGLATETLFDRTIPVEEKTREIDKYQSFWADLFQDGGKLHLPRLYVTDEAARNATASLAALGLSEKKFFVCAPAGTQNIAIKKWPADRFAEVIAWAEHQYGFQPLLVGHESERAEIEAVAMLLEEKGIASCCWLGKSGEIRILAALLKKAQLYVGNDTGAMHIAAVIGIPVVGIFGGGTFPRFLPFSNHSLGVIGDLPCFGCNWNCIFTDAPCVRLVSADDVRNAINMVLQEQQFNSNVLLASCSVSSETAEYIEKARIKFELCEADRAARLTVIQRQDREFKERLEICETESAARLEIFRTTQRQLEESEADRADRLVIIHNLDKRLEESEADRAARLDIIHSLDNRLAESETDRAARLETIHAIHATLQEQKNCIDKIESSTLYSLLKKMHLIP